MSGYLYQLHPHQFKRLPSGAVRVDGPWDKFGVIIQQQANGTFLIRGTGNKERRHHEQSLPQVREG